MAEESGTLARWHELAAAVAGDVVPDAVVVVAPQLWPMALIAKGVTSVARAHADRLLAARVRDLARTLDDVRREVARLGALPPEDLRRRLAEPDIVFLLATARDHFAVTQFRARLTRFARVLAGRVVKPDGSFEADLQYARAALDLSDEVVDFLAYLAQRTRTENHVTDAGGVKISRTPWETAIGLAAYIPSRPELDRERVLRLITGVRAAEQHGLMVADVRAPTFPDGVVGLANRERLRVPATKWSISPWGEEFLRRVRAAARSEAVPPRP